MTFEEIRRNELFGFDTDAIRREGYLDARNGYYIGDNPYPMGCDKYDFWERGYRCYANGKEETGD